jgi:hypothetical protein
MSRRGHGPRRVPSASIGRCSWCTRRTFATGTAPRWCTRSGICGGRSGGGTGWLDWPCSGPARSWICSGRPPRRGRGRLQAPPSCSPWPAPRASWPRWGAAAAIVGAICSLVAPAVTVLFVPYPEKPIFDAPWAYQGGGSGYSPFIVLLHPIVAAFVGTLAVLLSVIAFIGLYALVSRRSGLRRWGFCGAWGSACLWCTRRQMLTGYP